MKLRLGATVAKTPCTHNNFNKASNHFSGMGEALWRRKNKWLKTLDIPALFCYVRMGLSKPLTATQKVWETVQSLWTGAKRHRAGLMQHLVSVANVTASMSWSGNSISSALA